MKRGRNNEVAMNPWTSQQQVIRRISINNITRPLRLQVFNLAFELDLTHQVHIIGVEA